MENLLPGFRLHAINQWSHYFAPPELMEQVHLQIHGVDFLFKSNNPKIIKDLCDFFPASWQQKSQNPIVVDWKAPNGLEKEKNWDNIVSPDCHFYQDYISQRDFLARRRSQEHYELIAYHKIDDGLFNFLRFLLPLKLIREDKMLFHSSCVVNKDGEAYLFFGPSGVGKTTIARLCKPYGEVLGDDMNILSFHRGVQVEGAAVGQRLYRKENFGKTFPVRKAFWLIQAKEMSHKKIEEGQIKYFLSSFANLFWDQLTKREYHRVFQFAGQLKENLELQQLEFSQSREVWDYVRSI